MTSNFIGEDFLLQHATAVRLYHEYAEDCPIIDFHCHLPPDDIARDRQFDNLTELWLEGDHYKWRAMRANGIAESQITGVASARDKFLAWAETVPYTLRNPLYHWTHLELFRYFDIAETLSPTTAESIYDQANALIRTPAYSTQSLLRKTNVEVVCTSDDPTDDLAAHRQLRGLPDLTILPTWRPDPLLAVKDVAGYQAYLDRLAAAADQDITTFTDLLAAVQRRHDFFHEQGCRLADHGLDVFVADDFTDLEMNRLFARLRAGQPLPPASVRVFQSGMMHHLAMMNQARGWVQQFHVGALRNTNPRADRDLGPNTGFDSIGASQDPASVARFLGRLDEQYRLAPTILYNNNPSDNYLYAAMTGNFQDGSIPGKMQFGAAWWFLDQREGIEQQLNALSNLGLLRRFVGMVTDSRSFLSYPRHEYFRRVLCNMLGAEMEAGLLPNDLELIGQMVREISYTNALNYFPFNRDHPRVSARSNSQPVM
ncbi:MAG: glucuronate isomerase [Lewinella sp.]|nr:glucuronate isomerase [Lewinella sp.]